MKITRTKTRRHAAAAAGLLGVGCLLFLLPLAGCQSKPTGLESKPPPPGGPPANTSRPPGEINTPATR
jgi:hypothetical protein